MPRISCIIPVRNGAAYIAAALDSIAAQTRPPEQVVVVDDGSQDGSAAIAAAHVLQPEIISCHGNGPAAARNEGLDHATGELIAFLDADDLWRPAKLEQQIGQFAAAANLDLCFCGIENFAETGDAGKALDRDDWRSTLIGRDLRSFLLSATLASRTLFERIGRFDETLFPWGEDTEWFMRATASGARILRQDEVLVDRRLHQQNLTRQFADAQRLDTAFMLLARHMARKPEPSGDRH